MLNDGLNICLVSLRRETEEVRDDGRISEAICAAEFIWPQRLWWFEIVEGAHVSAGSQAD